MGCRIECVVDEDNTCCCLECGEYKECELVKMKTKRRRS